MAMCKSFLALLSISCVVLLVASSSSSSGNNREQQPPSAKPAPRTELQCYSCDSHRYPDCIEHTNPETQRVQNCTEFITDISPHQLRCVRIISNTDSRKEVVIRRCAVIGDCKYIAKNEKQSCHECNEDLCNGGK